MPAPTNRQGWGAERIAIAIAALLVFALAALRSTFGVSFYDDSHYVTVALRLADGARPFADEMSVQSLGFLPAAGFVWVWLHTFGTVGLVAAFRLFYVVLGAGVAFFAYLQLRRSLHPVVAALAVSVPLLCPPFNLLAPGYNQMTTIGFVLAVALAHRAEHDRSPLAAAGTGVALVFASITYPPLVIAAAALALSLALRTRDRRVIGPLVIAVGAGAALFVGALLSVVSIGEIRTGLQYAASNVEGFRSPAEKLQRAAGRLSGSLAQPILWPMWIAAVLACVPRFPKRVRAGLFFALPVLALAPTAQSIVFSQRVFGMTASAWLITFTFGAVVPATLWVAATKRRDLAALLYLTLPASAIGFATVAYSTDAPWMRGVAVIGIVPAAIAVIAAWGSVLEELSDERVVRAASALLIIVTVGVLWSESVDNGRPAEMSVVIDHGMYAGMHTTPQRQKEIQGLEAAGRKWVTPTSLVTFYGERQGYLAVGGRIYTNAVWLYPSRSDRYALAYFREHGGTPDVIFVDRFSMRRLDLLPYEDAARDSPFIAQLLAHYAMAETVADFDVWVKKP
jgi:hypothetical protein